MTDPDVEKLAEQIDAAPVEVTPEEAVGAAKPPETRQPSEFQGTDTAQLINQVLGGLTGEPDLTKKLRVGEATCAVLETSGVDSRVPPWAWLAVALAILGAVAVHKRQKAATVEARVKQQSQEAPFYGEP